MTQVTWMDLLDAYDFINLGAEFEHRAYVDLDTGRFYYASEDALIEEERPEGWDNFDRLLELPRAQDLDLDVCLVLDFVAQQLPQDYGTVSNFFQKPGACHRFKQLMERRGVIEQWYRFESNAIATALRAWCRTHGLEPVQRAVGE